MAKVKLIAYTNKAEQIVAAAAKLCYSNSSIDEIQQGLTPEKTESFLTMLSSLGHESPMEHISFTFAIEDVSRALLAQITRHRIASYSVQSQRYVKNKNFEFVVPPEIEGIDKAKEEFLLAMEQSLEHYEKLTYILKEKHKNKFLEDGKSEIEAEKMAEKLAIEDARFVLPNAAATKIICTFNARSLLNFFNHRCCNRAQWEIRDLAKAMLDLAKDVCPSIFKLAGPSCLKGPCPEGKMSCGKQKEIQKIYLGKDINKDS